MRKSVGPANARLLRTSRYVAKGPTEIWPIWRAYFSQLSGVVSPLLSLSLVEVLERERGTEGGLSFTLESRELEIARDSGPAARVSSQLFSTNLLYSYVHGVHSS